MRQQTESHRISEIQVSYQPRLFRDIQVSKSRDAYELAKEIWNGDTICLYEEFKILLLNRNNRVIGHYSLSRGGINGTIVDIRLIFGVALKSAATAILLVHNHPSGNLKPSPQDKRITEEVKKAGDLLCIKVLDHLIITRDGYYSFADEGLL